MPRAQTTKLYRTFVKGLITEAGPLTYPEDASINEDNCVIYQAGNRSRRLGIDLESGGEFTSYTTSITNSALNIRTEHVWMSAGNNSNKNFLVQQVGDRLYFVDLSQSPLHLGVKAFVVDLNTFAVNGQDPGLYAIHAASGKGYLFVVNPVCDPFLIQYNETTDVITTQRIYIQIRDFKGLDDGLANDEEPATLSSAHDYNLRNQGWLDPGAGGGASVTYYSPFGDQQTFTQAATTPISTYFTQHGRYPGNNKQWWVAKNTTTGAFDASLLSKFFFGNNRAPRGHYVVEAFNIDRSAVSGVAGIPVEKTNNRPTSVAFFSGRVWYTVDSTVYFSQILDDKRRAGFCYMEADPTSEDINELLPNDGGVIPIPEMIKARHLVPVGGGVLVFASNGLWFISGTDAGFSAVDMTVSKISPIGTDSPQSITHVQDNGGDLVLWWSKVGIQALSQKTGMFGTIGNQFDTSILSQTTIQSFYNDIPKAQLPHVKAHYDPSTNTVQWLFNDGTAPTSMFNRILNFDLTLKAFYPWTITNRFDPEGPWLSGVFPTVASTGQRNQYTKYVSVHGDGDTFYFGFSEENNTNFADWNTHAYTSFVETGFELMNDAMRKKQATYVYCYFRRTEEMYEASGDDFVLDKPSSCYFQVKWDWADSQISNKWSSKQQAYRLTRVPMFSEDDLTFDTGFPIVVTRNKVRGSGKSIQFRFENDAIGSNFDLLGWAVPYTGNTQA